MEQHDQNNLGQKGIIGLSFHIIVNRWVNSEQELNQGWNLEAGAFAEALQKYHYLDGLL